MMSITNPEIPFHGLIPGGCRPGLLISVSGKVKVGARRFNIDFIVGDTLNAYTMTTSDIVFHFNPRFNENCVVRNSRKGMKWLEEERKPHRQLPFTAGESFELLVLVDPNEFKVAVNGKHEFDFGHRHEMRNANIIRVEGDVIIKRIDFKSPGVPVAPEEPLSGSFNNIYHPVIPLNQPLPGLRVGSLVYISGRPKMLFTRFNINFLRSNGNSPPDNVFHFDVRRGNGQVVRNSFLDNCWGREDRIIPDFPFAGGVNFDLMVRVEASKFIVAINGQNYVEYAHRTEFRDVDTLSIEGDVNISSVRFN